MQDEMGMPVTVHVVDEGADDRAVQEVFDDFATLDRTFSPFRPESEVSLINGGRLQPDDAGPLVKQVIELCRQYQRATDGFFSAWIGGRFDPSGLVKGWAIDRACSLLDRHGYRDYFVDAGGDVQTRGLNAEGEPWRVGIRHPVHRDKFARVVLASGLAVATSGTYEKGEHVLDPHTGKAAGAWLSFSVAGPDILEADVYATACLAMGAHGLDFLARVTGYEAYAIDRRLQAVYTPGFDALCERLPPSG